jgi:DNA-binding NtrC family response regulator
MGYSRILIRQRTEEHQVLVSKEENHLGALVGASEPMRELYGLLRAVAPTPATVQITGQSGSGKELVARTIHELSGRSGPLVVFDASVTDPEMVRNDLFGHVKGAFTGAAGSREGAFRRAHQGTLFIDEIGELPMELQPRLLRALENREVTPIGSDQPVRVDVRVITATHRDLAAMVQAGDFRADLYYRLSVVPIRVPSLPEIRSDIPLLVQNFIEKLSLNCRVSPEAMAALQRYHWPGNVRELRNVLERAAVFRQGDAIQPQDLYLPEESVSVTPPTSSSSTVSPEPESASLAQLKELEKKMILEALARNNHNKTAAARELKIPLSTLKRRLKEYEDGD